MSMLLMSICEVTMAEWAVLIILFVAFIAADLIKED